MNRSGLPRLSRWRAAHPSSALRWAESSSPSARGKPVSWCRPMIRKAWATAWPTCCANHGRWPHCVDRRSVARTTTSPGSESPPPPLRSTRTCLPRGPNLPPCPRAWHEDRARTRNAFMLNGRVALVTGGGSGLGAAIVQVLAEAGASVVVADIRVTCAREVVARVADAGGRAVDLEMDVGDSVQVEEGLRFTMETFGRLDIAVNNAGVDKTESFEKLEVEDWDRILRVNLRGPFLVAKQVFPLMRRQGDG